MKYDIFTFNNEIDMLDIRLNILNDYVDYFIIIESTETFTGIYKPLYYLDNIARFYNFRHKIIHHIVDDTPAGHDDPNCNQLFLEQANNSDNVCLEDNHCWLREFYQKECIKDAISHLSDDDICFISDVDEIWNYELNYNLGFNTILKPKINNCYLQYLNFKSSEIWTQFTGPIVTYYRNIKNKNLNHLRTLKKSKNMYTFLENGGWHFNALGGIDKKINDFKHPVYTKKYIQNRAGQCVIDESDLPRFVLDNKKKYEHLFI